MGKLDSSDIPSGWPVAPIRAGSGSASQAADLATCGACGLSWDDRVPTSMTPTPSGRCPFEPFHGGFHADRLRLDSGGYHRGAYYGLGLPVYLVTDPDGESGTHRGRSKAEAIAAYREARDAPRIRAAKARLFNATDRQTRADHESAWLADQRMIDSARAELERLGADMDSIQAELEAEQARRDAMAAHNG